MPSLGMIGFWVDCAENKIGEKSVKHSNYIFANKEAKCYYEPLGVIGIIVGKSSALYWPMCQIVPALLAGNAVVFKHSHVWHQKFKELWQEVWPYAVEGLFTGL